MARRGGRSRSTSQWLLLLLLLDLASRLWPGFAHGDIYSGIAGLRDSLRAWETLPPAASIAGDSRLAAEAESSGTSDAWMQSTLTELFPGAEITQIGEAVRIELPPLYDGRFGSVLWAGRRNRDWVFSVDLERRDSLMVLDKHVVDGLPADNSLAWLQDHVATTLTALRTLAVPGAAPPPGWGAGPDAQVPGRPVQVKLVGRDIETFEYEPAVWRRCLTQLARGMMVYAFLLEAEVETESAALSWAVFFRVPEGQWQHLVEWREEVGTNMPAGHAVRLVPGVRLDNLEALFAPTLERVDAPRWSLPVR